MEISRNDYIRFHPLTVHVNAGTLTPEQYRNLPERMCLFYEIELITAGDDSGVYTLDQFLPATPGSIYIRRPGTIVQGKGQYSFFSVIFDTFFDEVFLDQYQLGSACLGSGSNVAHLHALYEREHFLSFLDRLPPRIEVKKPEQYLPYFEDLFHNYIEQRDSFQMLAARDIFSILALLQQELEGIPASSESGVVRSLLDVKKYMDVHYRDSITLDCLSERSSMSREYLCRQFKRFYRITPMGYLKSIRMFHAKHLLTTTDLTVARIVEECGFSSEQYFYQQFQKEADCSPLQYRKKNTR